MAGLATLRKLELDICPLYLVGKDTIHSSWEFHQVWRGMGVEKKFLWLLGNSFDVSNYLIHSWNSCLLGDCKYLIFKGHCSHQSQVWETTDSEWVLTGAHTHPPSHPPTLTPTHPHTHTHTHTHTHRSIPTPSRPLWWCWRVMPTSTTVYAHWIDCPPVTVTQCLYSTSRRVSLSLRTSCWLRFVHTADRVCCIVSPVHSFVSCLASHAYCFSGYVTSNGRAIILLSSGLMKIWGHKDCPL